MGDGIGAFAFWLAVGGMGCTAVWAFSPVLKAWADRIAGGGAAEHIAELEERLVHLEQRGLTSGEVEQAYARLAEMEERVDFAERLLAQQTGQRPALPGQVQQ